MKSIAVMMLSLWIGIHQAHALVEVPTLRFGLGHSLLNISAQDSRGNQYFSTDSTSLGGILTLNPSFLWDIPQVRSRVGFGFISDIGSQFGFVSVIGIGLNYVFYPMGLSSSREVKDDGAVLVKTRISPFIELQVTPTRVAISVPSELQSGQTSLGYFAVTVIETSVGAGLDYPLGDNLIAFGGLHYRFAGFTSQEAEVGRMTYGGFALKVGIMTNFY